MRRSSGDGRRRLARFDQVFRKHESSIKTLLIKTHRGAKSLQGLEFFAGLEADRFAWRDGNLRARARIASNACLSWLYGKDAETAKFNAVTLFESPLHFPKDSFHGHFGLGFGNSRLVHNFVDDI